MGGESGYDGERGREVRQRDWASGVPITNGVFGRFPLSDVKMVSSLGGFSATSGAFRRVSIKHSGLESVFSTTSGILEGISL